MEKLEKLINELYEIDCFIEEAKIKEILSYGKTIVPYLEAMIDEAVTNYEKYKKDEDLDDFFPLHAFWLLAELEEEDSLPKVLEFLSQNEDFLDWWLGDILGEDFWQVIYELGKNRIEELEKFLTDKKKDLYAKSAICTALSQIALACNDKREQILKIFENIIKTSKDEELVAFIISSVDECGGKEIEETVNWAFDSDRVDESIIDKDSVTFLPVEEKLLSIYEQYERFRGYEFSRYSPHNPNREEYPEDEDDDDDDDYTELKKSKYNFLEPEEDDSFIKQEPIRVTKTGNNEPCPCGSGKKYKKCCGKI